MKWRDWMKAPCINPSQYWGILWTESNDICHFMQISTFNSSLLFISKKNSTFKKVEVIETSLIYVSSDFIAPKSAFFILWFLKFWKYTTFYQWNTCSLDFYVCYFLFSIVKYILYKFTIVCAYKIWFTANMKYFSIWQSSIYFLNHKDCIHLFLLN